jgi:3-oxoacyl-[acyl-carrier protein] reductase
VVVNAGILKLGGVADVSVADLDQMLAVNVRGVFLAIQAASLPSAAIWPRASAGRP